MSNIFEISQEYLNIINEIENAEGEINEELANRLTITEADFADKMNAYQRVIKSKEAAITLHKDEKARLDRNIESMNNTITRLKKVMTDALILMGDTGKSGNKTLRTDLYNFFTVDTTSVDVDALLFNLDEPKALDFLRIKMPLMLTNNEKELLLDNINSAYEKDPVGILPLYNKVTNVAYTVEPDKILIKKYLEQQEDQYNTIKDQKGELELEKSTVFPDLIALPGVKLITTTNIRNR